MSKLRGWGILLITGAGLLLPEAATATFMPSTWAWNTTSSIGTAISGTASFSLINTGSGTWDLQIVLSNTSMAFAEGTADILTGLYFDLIPNSGSIGALAMKSAVQNFGMMYNGTGIQTAPNATPVNGSTNICAPNQGLSSLAPVCASTTAGGWETSYSSSGLGGGAKATQHWGIGTTGQGGVFSGNSGDAGAFDYGIAPVPGVDWTVGSGITNSTATGGGKSGAGYIWKAATFTLTGLTTDQFSIANVAGAYGTAPESTPAATNTASLPEPASLSMMAGGMLLLLGLGRRRSKA
jgi:hypothetical protein